MQGYTKDKTLNCWRDSSGRIYVSVTMVLKDVGCLDLRFIPEGDMYTDRGTRLHEIAERIIRGEKVEDDEIEPGIAPYVAALRSFIATVHPRPVSQEERMFHRTLGLCGKPDLIAEIDGFGLCVVDYKTGAAQAWHHLQTAGYMILADRGPLRRFSLYLGDKGKWKFDEHREDSDVGIFTSALSVTHWKRSKGIVT